MGNNSNYVKPESGQPETVRSELCDPFKTRNTLKK